MESDVGGEESGRALGGWAAAATFFFSKSARTQHRFAALIIRLMPILSTEAQIQPWAKHGGARGALVGWICAWLVVWILAASCAAQKAPNQESAAAGKAPPVRGPAGPIQYVGPDTYILLDAEGRPQAMPGMTYEDFMAAWKQSQQAEGHERQARFTIDSVDINGTAAGDRAELRFNVTVRLLSDEPVDVPLGLIGAILKGQPRFGPDVGGGDAARKERLDFDPGRGGFVAHLAGRAGERRSVSLELLVPLARDGAETTLALNCPRALTATLALDVDAAVSEANVSKGALLTREPRAGGGTRLSAAGLAGQFRISWSTAEVAAAELSTVLSAAGAIQVSIDGRSVRTDARLTVRSYGGSFDRFRVRLPPGATLIQSRANAGDKEPGYRITLEDEAGGGEKRRPAAALGQVALVQLLAKQQGPVVVELATEQPLGLSDSDVAVKLAGFEVLGAVRQFGDVALRVADDWQARWDAGQFVRQVDASELEATLQQPGLTGAFQYDRQPWSLGARVSARERRVQVTPEYELECLPDEARLKVHFTYQILGARAYEFRVDLRGWERTADPLESGGLVDRERTVLTEDGLLVLPLSQPSLRRAEISIVLRRAVPRDARRLDLPLPVPVAESVATGDLVVRAAPGIELMPDAARSKGLTPTPVTTADGAAPGDDLSEFRFRCFQPDAVFAADRVSRPRDVAVEVATHVDIGPEQARVRERVEYEVRFEPITELMFDLPGELKLDDEVVDVALVATGGDDERDASDGRPETLLRFASDPESGDPAGGDLARRVRVVLPQPRLGWFAVELRYSVNRPQSPSSRGSWSIPLGRPVDGRPGECRATVRMPRDLGVALDPASAAATWKSAETNRESASQGAEFVATRPEPTLPLVVHAVDVNLPSATLVERAWLQTWLTGSTRQDRAAFRFRTSGQMVTVELPPETAAEEVEVLLDGQPADGASRETGRISVQMAPRSDNRGAEMDQLEAARPHTLELRYRRASIDRVLTRRRLTPPQMVGMKAMADVYWQIVLPGDRHVIESPPQLAAASQWQWLGSFWGRRPTHSQAELEQWVGASTQQAPTSAQNEYLYSGLAPVSSIEVVTAPRWFIVLVSSGAVLALALAWMYVPAVRRRWIVVAVACLLATLAVAYPTPAMLLAQAAVLGVLLAGLAVLIARLAARPTQWYLPVPGGSSHRQLTPQLTPQFTPRVESVVMGSMASAVASTAPTAPSPVPESKS